MAVAHPDGPYVYYCDVGDTSIHYNSGYNTMKNAKYQFKFTTTCKVWQCPAHYTLPFAQDNARGSVLLSDSEGKILGSYPSDVAKANGCVVQDVVYTATSPMQKFGHMKSYKRAVKDYCPKAQDLHLRFDTHAGQLAWGLAE